MIYNEQATLFRRGSRSSTMSLPIAGNKKVLSTLQVLLKLSENGITDFKFMDVRFESESAVSDFMTSEVKLEC
jgi:hypothetical protein